MRGPWKQFWVPLLASLSICVLSAQVIITLRHSGRLRAMELRTYDVLLHLNKPAEPPSPDVTIVAIDEHQISQVLGHYPVRDQELEAALRSILSHSPAAIGVDLFRDIPVGEESNKLAELLQGNSNLVAIS